MIVIFITFQAQIKKELVETCFSPRLSSVTGLVMVLARRPRWLLDAMFLAGDLWDGESENEQKINSWFLHQLLTAQLSLVCLSSQLGPGGIQPYC